MRIVLWIGNAANHIALSQKVSERYDVVGIVIEKRVNNSKFTFKKTFQKIIERLIVPSINRSWVELMSHYKNNFKDSFQTSVLILEDINSVDSFNFTSDLNPDLVLVSGTRLVRKKLLSIKPSIGILNLHTGLSPYIKGGPNCTNWCISEGEFDLIGNTIMWIDEGIDSGNILATEQTKFNGSEDLFQIHLEVMEHAHDLYLRAIASIINKSFNNVPQNQLAKGRTYYNKEWGLKEKINLKRNLNRFKDYLKKPNEMNKVKTININF